MKRFWWTGTIGFICFVFMSLGAGAERSPLKGLKICLDPGHGNTAQADSFRVGPSGEREEWVNLRVGMLLRDMLRDAGAVVVQLSQAMIDVDNAGEAVFASCFIAAVAAGLASGKPTVATTAGLAPARAEGRSVAERLAGIATAPEVIERVGGLSLTGGDVAMAVCTALGAEAIWPRGEVVAGQPWGVLDGGIRPGLPVATKAGSFGDANALCAAAAFLAGLQHGDTVHEIAQQ